MTAQRPGDRPKRPGQDMDWRYPRDTSLDRAARGIVGAIWTTVILLLIGTIFTLGIWNFLHPLAAACS